MKADDAVGYLVEVNRTANAIQSMAALTCRNSFVG
jgi:hypothetical protein